VNVGTGIGITVGELAEKILALLGGDVRLVVDERRVRPEKSEVLRLVCDNSKMKQLTGWQPRYSLEEGLSETVAWIAAHLDLYKPQLYNI
jgi:nucleoside-diphosphate-sugar epimerase